MRRIFHMGVIGCALLLATSGAGHAQSPRGRDTSADAQIRETHRATRAQQQRDAASGRPSLPGARLPGPAERRSDCLTPDGCRLVDQRRAQASAAPDDTIFLPDRAVDLGRYLAARAATAQSDTRVCIEAATRSDRPGVRLPPAEFMRRQQQAEAEIKRCQETHGEPFGTPLARLRTVLSEWAARRPVSYEGLRQLDRALSEYNFAWGVPGVDAAEKVAGARVLAVANPIIEARKAALEDVLRPQIVADVSKPENDMLIDERFTADPKRRQFYADRRRSAIIPQRPTAIARQEVSPAIRPPPRATQSGLFGLRIGVEHSLAKYRDAADSILACGPIAPAALRTTSGEPQRTRYLYGCKYPFGLFEVYDSVAFHSEGEKLSAVVRVRTPRIAPGCEGYQQVIDSSRLENNSPGDGWKLLRSTPWRRDTPLGSVQEGWRVYQKGDVYAHIFTAGREKSGGDRCYFSLPVIWTVYSGSPPSAGAPPFM